MSSQPMADAELVNVFETEQESEGMVVHGLLTSAGIESVITSIDATQNIFPGVGGVVVRVNSEQADEARRIIQEYQSAPILAEDAEGSAEGSDAEP